MFLRDELNLELSESKTLITHAASADVTAWWLRKIRELPDG
ncbi:hypothetical protein [Streptomyces fractus]